MDLQQIIGDAHANELQASSGQQSLTKRYIEPQLDEILKRLKRFREEAVRIMRTKNLVPSPDELAGLRAQGLVPKNVDATAGLNVD